MQKTFFLPIHPFFFHYLLTWQTIHFFVSFIHVQFQGAFCSLMFGMVLGVTQLVLKFVFKKPGCGEADTRPAFIADFHYMYFAIVLFWSTLIVAVVVR